MKLSMWLFNKETQMKNKKLDESSITFSHTETPSSNEEKK